MAHDKIADAGVIGVYSQSEQTELPRQVLSYFHISLDCLTASTPERISSRAIQDCLPLALLRSQNNLRSHNKSMPGFESRLSITRIFVVVSPGLFPHRLKSTHDAGPGILLIDAIPRSAAGKILRKELRGLAGAEGVVASIVKARL